VNEAVGKYYYNLISLSLQTYKCWIIGTYMIHVLPTAFRFTQNNFESIRFHRKLDRMIWPWIIRSNFLWNRV